MLSKKIKQELSSFKKAKMQSEGDSNKFVLVPGMKSEPLFKTQKEYEDFRESFSKSVQPALDRQRRARAESWKAAFDHLLD